MIRKKWYLGIVIILSLLICCGCERLPFGKTIVLTGKGQTIAKYKCLRFKTQLRQLNKKRLVITEAEKYARFQRDTGRGDRGAKLFQDLKDNNYAQVESRLVNCLCQESREDKDARKIWRFEDTMGPKKPESLPQPAGATP